MPSERSIRSARPARPDGNRIDLAIGIGLMAVTLAVYAGVRGHAFVNLDDPEYVTANPHVRAGLTWASAGWAFTHVHSATWHPLTSLSHMLDVQLFGLRPGAHLMENAALHALNSVLLFAALRGMTQRRWPSAVVAALFALHPQHVESVAWISERKDVLSTLFWMLTLLAYAAYAAAPRAGRYLLVVLLFCLGLLAKPMLVTLPFVLLLLDYWPLRRFAADPVRRVVEKLPLFVLAGAAAAVTYIAQQQAGAVLSTAAVPLSARFANAPIAYATYLWKTFIPIHLAAFYPLQLPVSAWAAATATAALALVSAGALVTVRRRPYLFVGWCWYLGTLVPVLGLVKQGEQAMADRYTYVPLIGVFIMVVWALADLAAERRWPAWVPAGATAAALAVCAVATAAQIAVWRDSVALFDHALRVTSGNYAAHANYGAAMMDQGHFEEALSHFEAALRLRPNFVKAQIDAGLARASLGQTELARADYERALALDADSAMAHYDLGVLLAQQGRLEDAVAHYRAAVAADPDYGKAYNNLGLALAALGEPAQAIAAYDAALRVDPGLAPAHLNLAIALEAAGRSDDALAHYETAARLAPDEPLTHLNLGAVLAARGRLDEAIEQYRTALRLRPDLTDAQVALTDALERRSAGSIAR